MASRQFPNARESVSTNAIRRNAMERCRSAREVVDKASLTTLSAMTGRTRRNSSARKNQAASGAAAQSAPAARSPANEERESLP